MTKTTERRTIVGPDNCPECKLEAKIADLEAQIAAHVCTDAMCGDLYERWPGFFRRSRCSVGWWPSPKSSLRARLDRAESARNSVGHHCQPHSCDFGPNCGSWIKPEWW